MLRKETREFLENFYVKYPNRNQKAIQERFLNRNRSQICLRAVKNVNDSFDDIDFIMRNLPPKYRDKIQLDRGISKILDSMIKQNDNKARLRIASQQIKIGVDIIKTVIEKNESLKKLFGKEYDHIVDVTSHILSRETGKILQQPKQDFSIKEWEKKGLQDIVPNIRDYDKDGRKKKRQK